MLETEQMISVQSCVCEGASCPCFLELPFFKDFWMLGKIWFSVELTADYKSGLKKKDNLKDYNAKYGSGEALGKSRKYLANCRTLIS